MRREEVNVALSYATPPRPAKAARAKDPSAADDAGSEVAPKGSEGGHLQKRMGAAAITMGRTRRRR